MWRLTAQTCRRRDSYRPAWVSGYGDWLSFGPRLLFLLGFGAGVAGGLALAGGPIGIVIGQTDRAAAALEAQLQVAGVECDHHIARAAGLGDGAVRLMGSAFGFAYIQPHGIP